MTHRILAALGFSLLLPTVTAAQGFGPGPSGYGYVGYGSPNYGVAGNCGPIQQPCQSFCVVEKTVMVPTWVTEMRTVQVTECRTEMRQRPVTTYKQVAETKMVTEQYTVQVPEQRVRTETFTVCRPVTRQVPRQYTVNVPYQETRTATRRVCKYVPVQEPRTVNVTEQRVRTENYTVMRPVTRQQEQQYTVNVPYTETREGTRKVCRWVPVTNTRTIRVDEGRCETVQVAVPPPCGGTHRGHCRRRCCSQPCPPPCGPVIVNKRVWVPNIVEKQIPYTTMQKQWFDEPYKYLVSLCRPEIRTRTVNYVEQVPETMSREVPFTVCVPKTEMVTVNRPQWFDEPYSYVVNLCRQEVRTQMVDVQEMVAEQQTRQVPYMVMVPQVRSRQVPVTTMRNVPVQQMEMYPVTVPQVITRQVPVTVCKMVPQMVQCTVPVPAAPNCPPRGF